MPRTAVVGLRAPPALVLVGRSADPEGARDHAIVLLGATRDAESGVSDEEAEVDGVPAGREVRLELELAVVDQDVARLPEVDGVLAVEHRVIAVVATLIAVDVQEGFPGPADRTQHTVVDPEVI